MIDSASGLMLINYFVDTNVVLCIKTMLENHKKRVFMQNMLNKMMFLMRKTTFVSTK